MRCLGAAPNTENGMDWMLIITTGLAFVFSFIFALGGVGSALVLIPVLHWLGVPLNAAKPTGLMINAISMGAASFSNIKNGLLDFRLGMPIIITSMILAPVGAWCSVLVSRNAVLWVFVGFLVFSGLMLLFYRRRGGEENYREDRPVVTPALIGAGAGFLSGLLGVGGGMMISPMLIFLGFNPKKVATITAFVVPFSSIIAFAAYALMGTVQWQVLICASVAAYFGGTLGTKVMHGHLRSATIKSFLGVVLLGMAGKMIFSLF